MLELGNIFLLGQQLLKGQQGDLSTNHELFWYVKTKDGVLV